MSSYAVCKREERERQREKRERAHEVEEPGLTWLITTFVQLVKLISRRPRLWEATAELSFKQNNPIWGKQEKIKPKKYSD